MGYYTDYKIEHDGSEELTEKMSLQLEGIAGYSFEVEGPNELRNYHAKWYEHEDNMRTFSKLYPKILFTVEGHGEESGDEWRRYYKNGKCQIAQAEITYPPFDESKLE